MSHRALEVDGTGRLFVEPNEDLLAGDQLALRRQKAAADAQACYPIVVLAFRSSAPIGEEIHRDSRMSALFDRSHYICGQLPLRLGEG